MTSKTKNVDKAIAGFDKDGIYEIPRKEIHPDPDQPRVKVDDDLQSSIDSEGILQAITVRPHPTVEDEWMIVDGERRWVGGSHLKTIPCRIRLDLEEPVDRLITQLASNTGRPLTAIEQARAFKKALDADPKLSQAKLAERLGIPRTTIGDRIRLIEIHSAWMKLIESGRLQISHAPLIHQYRAVPAEYQVKAAQKVAEGDGWQIAKYEKGDVIPIGAFRDILHAAFKDYVVKLDEVRSYNGPVLEIEEEVWSYGPGPKKLKKVKYAADITIWRPIKREAEKRAKKARESAGSSSYSRSYESPLSKALKGLKAAGVEITERKRANWNEKLRAGESEVFTEQGWVEGIDPKAFLAQVDPSKLIHWSVFGPRIITTDSHAVAVARESFNTRAIEKTAKKLAPLKSKLGPDVLERFAVSGAGTTHLLAVIDPFRGSPKVVALALGLPVVGSIDTEIADGDSVLADQSQSTAATLLSALAACKALEINVPEAWEVADLVNRGLREIPFVVGKLPVVATTSSATEPKSKKQLKREERAAGKQVGDPSRAKKSGITADDFEIGEPEEGDVPIDEAEFDEEELVEA